MSAQASGDCRMGIAWWNACSKATRARWLAASGSAVPALAWECFKRSSALPDPAIVQFTMTTQTQACALPATLGEI